MARRLAPTLALASITAAALAACSSCSAPSDTERRADGGIPWADVYVPPKFDAAPPVDAGEDVYGSNWDASDLLGDPSIWTPVPDNKDCGLFVGKVVPDPFPKRVWTSCGPGCEVAEAALGISHTNEVGWNSASASERGGETYLRLSHWVQAHGNLHIVSRLSDGAHLAAVQARKTLCGTLGAVRDAAFVILVSRDALRGATLQSTAPGSPVVWGKWLSKPGPQGSVFAWNGGWGVGIGTTLLGTTSEKDTKLSVLASDANEFVTYGRDEQVVWAGWDGSPAVRAYSLTGVKTLWKSSAPGFLRSLALGEQHMAWIMADGPEYKSKYTMEWAKLYWSPRTDVANGAKVAGTADITPINTGLDELRVGGGFAATKGCHLTGPDTGYCPIHIVQLATGKRWTIKPRAGSAYQQVMAVSASTILIGEVDWPGQPSEGQYLRRLLRFDTSQLDALEEAW